MATFNLHPFILSGLGCPIGELFDLEALSAMCEKKNKYSFFFTSAPLNIPGGVASRELDLEASAAVRCCEQASLLRSYRWADKPFSCSPKRACHLLDSAALFSNLLRSAEFCCYCKNNCHFHCCLPRGAAKVAFREPRSASCATSTRPGATCFTAGSSTLVLHP